MEAKLRVATDELCWLLSRGYASTSSVKLVGDRHDLTARQRLAVSRSACGDDDRMRRRQHRVRSDQLGNEVVWIDGYNVLTSVEAALAGGVILIARDGCYRDMASMHGSYRRVAETIPAIEAIGKVIADWNNVSCRWLLDRPVSNSGRLKTWLSETATRHGWSWELELVKDPDPILRRSDHVVASADSQILDRCSRWVNLAAEVIRTKAPDAWLVDLQQSKTAQSSAREV